MIREQLQEVEARIEAACVRAGRKREDVTLIAVSKTKPVEALREAYDLGIRVFGENKVQELTEKYDALPISQARKMRTLFANAAKCEPDSQGRILIPAKLRQYAALEREVIINGASKCLELWNPERWAPIEDAGLDPENLAAAMEELGF